MSLTTELARFVILGCPVDGEADEVPLTFHLDCECLSIFHNSCSFQRTLLGRPCLTFPIHPMSLHLGCLKSFSPRWRASSGETLPHLPLH